MTNRGWGGPLIMLNCMPTCSQVEKFDQDYHISADLSYPATRSIGQNSKFTVFLFVCRVTDFSARSLPIGVKFCMAIRPNLKQVLSHFGGRAPGTAEFWASTGAIWWICFLMKQLFFSIVHWTQNTGLVMRWHQTLTWHTTVLSSTDLKLCSFFSYVDIQRERQKQQQSPTFAVWVELSRV